jgi:hypothetical protein
MRNLRNLRNRLVGSESRTQKYGSRFDLGITRGARELGCKDAQDAQVAHSQVSHSIGFTVKVPLCLVLSGV